ncbi:MAG: hypothetical protein U9Q90_05565 [Campylobacterota bacterium]|nr:hypothetical protein [Campylobacterota bacterium]
MKFLYAFFFAGILLTSLLFSQPDISREIAKLKHADESQRYIIMNRIKQELAGMNAQQRASAIAQLRNKTSTGNNAPRSQSTQGGNRQSGTRNSMARGTMAQPSSGHEGSGGTPHAASQSSSSPSVPQGGQTGPSHSNPAMPAQTGPKTPNQTGPQRGLQAPSQTGPQAPPQTTPQAPPQRGPQAPHHMPGPRPGRH